MMLSFVVKYDTINYIFVRPTADG